MPSYQQYDHEIAFTEDHTAQQSANDHSRHSAAPKTPATAFQLSLHDDKKYNCRQLLDKDPLVAHRKLIYTKFPGKRPQIAIWFE